MPASAPMHRFLTAAVLLLTLAGASPAAPALAQRPTPAGRESAAQRDTGFLAGLQARSIGPAGMSGRVAAVEAVIRDPNTIYVGAATGGVWKSLDAGITWKPIFEDRESSSIGAIALFQPNPAIVWVGTGEANVRNSMGVGSGVYRSIDAGANWERVGLENSERISRILTHPTDPNIAYVAALGPAWSDGEERGVFRTTDGGRTWKRVLYVNPSTGAADLVMDPTNPNKLFAAMWEYRRWPWFFRSGGEGSGLYVTYDGGESWKRYTEKDGLPKGELGRIGLAIAQSNPQVVYAIIEAEKSVLLRSDNGGQSWRTVNDSRNIAPRPFYYADIRVDPENENRVYNLHSIIEKSEDGGRTFREFVGWKVHPDHHALWIHPANPDLMMNGNDGGVYITRDRGKTWRFVENLPFAQFYHINIDMARPFNVYGGLQDNGSWRGPSQVWENGGIRNYHWTEVGFGDGFATVVDPSDPRFGYAMSQGGMLMRFDLVTGERRSIRPWAPDTVDLRFNWNAGIAIDPFDPRTIYYGSQFVHMSPDRGDTWRILSPDLTTNRKEWQEQAKSGGLTLDVTAAENFTTILTIAPSAVERGVIWVGTDDGNVQLTRDGGQTWTNVVRNIRGVPANSWVPHVEPSKFDAGTAFAVFDNHRRGDFKPYVYRTTDYGRSWTSIATPAIQGFAHVIEQDPIEPNLLFLGTEQGMWVSLNGGRSWRKWTAGLPTVPVTGLIVHPRDHDLVIGTHGRAVYILDDLGPLRALARNPELQRQALHMFDIPTTIQYTVKQVDGYRFPADAMFRGENRPYGALITYVVTPSATPASPAARAAGARADTAAAGQDPQRAKIEVLDATGKVIRDFNGPAEAGIHRVAWNLRTNGFKRPPSDEEENEPEEFRPQGPAVLPGSYTVRIKANGQEATQRVEIVSDPREEYTLEARRVKFERLMMVGRQQELAVEALERLRQTDKAIDLVLQMTRDDTTKRELRQSADSLKQKVQELWEVFTGPRNLQGIVRSSDAVLAKLGFAYGALASSSDAPTEAQMTYHRQGEEALREALPRVNRFLTEDVERFRQQVQAAGFSIFPETTPIRAEAAMR